MSAIIESGHQTLRRTQEQNHSGCVICGQGNSTGLGVDFRLCEDGYVEARLGCPSFLQGYDGILHGGVTSSLLDGAMTNCLFAHGVVAVTAELRVRFRDPISVQFPLLVRAAICDSKPPLYVLEAQIMQGGKLKAKAKGKFMARASGKPD